MHLFRIDSVSNTVYEVIRLASSFPVSWAVPLLPIGGASIKVRRHFTDIYECSCVVVALFPDRR